MLSQYRRSSEAKMKYHWRNTLDLRFGYEANCPSEIVHADIDGSLYRRPFKDCKWSGCMLLVERPQQQFTGISRNSLEYIGVVKMKLIYTLKNSLK
jgi:hypothetical protein